MTISGTGPYTPPADRKQTFIEHYGSTVVAQGLTLGLGVLTGVLSARILGPVGRGEYAAIIIWPMGIATLCALGINQAIAFNVGRKAFTVSEVATASVTIGLIQSALSVLIGLLVVPIALAKYSATVQHLGIVFVLLTPAFLLAGYPANLFQGLPDLLRFNLIRVIAPLTYFAGLAGLYVARRGSLHSVIFWQLGGYVLALAIGIAMVWGFLHPRLRWNRSAIPSLIQFGYRTQATNLANYFNQRIDQLVLSLLVPPQQLGFYAVAVTLSTAVAVFPQAAGIVAFSTGSGQNNDDARRTVGVAFRASLIWLLIACGGLYALSPFLIRFVFGSSFEGSIIACRILVPGALMIGLNQVLYNGAGALGRPGLPSIAEGVSMAVTAIGLFILVPRYGYIGAAIVSTVAYTISFLLMLGLANRYLGLSISDLLAGGNVPSDAAR